MEQWCTRRLCLQNQNSQKNYGRKGKHSPLGTEGLLKLKYVNVLKFEKSQNFFLFFYPHTLTFRLKRPVYRGFKGEGKCEGKLSTLTLTLTQKSVLNPICPAKVQSKEESNENQKEKSHCKDSRIIVPEKCSCLVPRVQLSGTKSSA